RPALQIVGRAPAVGVVCGMYLIILKSGEVKFFGDATVNIEPDAEVLAEIASQMADAVRGLDITPPVALISFSNFGSAPHPQSEKVARAVALVQERRPDIEIDGELQADTAVLYDQLKEHYPFSRLTDAANVLVFPDLASGNVAYKLMST